MARTADIDRVILIVEIVLAIGRSIVLVTSMFVGINIAIAAYNFATGDMGGNISFVVDSLQA